jgi:cysteine synthase A
MNNLLSERIQGLSSLIGNTPLLAVDFLFRGKQRSIYAKAENLNMTGSIKDRMAFYILKNALLSGELQPGTPIIEATSGNTGISVSAIGRALGFPVTIFMPDWMSSERINLIKSYGATVRLVTHEEDGFLGSIRMADKLAEKVNGFRPQQFSNEQNTMAHYQTTGPELWWQLRYRGINPNAFVAGVGTGGTVMGVGKFLKEQDSGIRIYPLEPSNSPTLSTGYQVGKHRIQGISDEFIPPIINLGFLNEVVEVDDGDSIIMAQKLASMGIGVGISSGANFLGALLVQEKLGNDAVVATIFSDDNKKYLSTDLLKDEPVKEGFISSDVRLVSFKSIKRVCYTCCNPSTCEEARYLNSDGLPELPFCPRRLAH